MKNHISIWLCYIFSMCVFYGWGAIAVAQVRHEVFLPRTDHELHVYRVFGDAPGKTIMIVGGIQGDEPGGYLSADLYADIHLKKGNLIVVPRANFYSILLNRRDGETGDMNRKFSTNESTPASTSKQRNLEEEVVAILKHLIAESDCLLNLHEGSGFYNPDWLNDQENPMRFGQSIIFDTAEYKTPGTNRSIRLEEIANRVIERVNPQIENPRYHFKANNHDTLSTKTSHKEQRASATYYALTKANIPAFGVELSKTIDSLETKLRLDKLVINTIMEEFDIHPDTPGVVVEPPKLDYLLVKVNEGYPFALRHGDVLEADTGADIVVTDILANYERGLVADIENFGTTNDTNRPFKLEKPTKVIVRKDAQQFGWIEIRPREKDKLSLPQPTVITAMPPSVSEDREPARAAIGEKISQPNMGKVSDTPREIHRDSLRVKELVVDVDGTVKTIGDNGTLRVNKGARLIIHGTKSSSHAGLDNNIMINFKGFNPPKKSNDGNDMMIPINTAKDLWERYSVSRKGKRYPVVAMYNDKIVGEFFVEIQ